tara:strand:- start:174 stop:638 length:465 start_codon:yes stop_codon:yes gene_type:complete
MSALGGRIALALSLNVLIKDKCQGCRFHNFPYRTKGIVADENGNYPIVEFNSQNDIWDYVELIISESKQIQSQRGSCYNTIIDVYEQLPFFTCYNFFLDEGHQRDIAKYLYCDETGVPPYNGGYGDQPRIWVDKYNTIKNAIAIFKKINKVNNG